MESGGGFRIRIGRSNVHGVQVVGRWRAEYLREPATDEERLALALYREALALEHLSAPYSFLGFFKILNIRGRQVRKPYLATRCSAAQREASQ